MHAGLLHDKTETYNYAVWCPLLTFHINSTVSHSSLSLWSVATYSCDGSSRTCQIDRSWNGSVPACAGLVASSGRFE